MGTGAKVIGGVRVGAGAHMGANAVVVDDVPAGATWWARRPGRSRAKARARALVQSPPWGYSGAGGQRRATAV